MLFIIEIYRSIQGESSFAGLPCTFVRLAGCNLRCTWCDSEYTFSGGKKMSLEEVEAEVKRLAPAGLIEITGGEPMLQERELLPLMEKLLADRIPIASRDQRRALTGSCPRTCSQDSRCEVSAVWRGRRRLG